MTVRTVRHRIEAIAASLFFWLLRRFSIDAASAIGGWVGRVVGTRLPVTNRARANLARFMPELSERERERVVREMWDNLGRNSAEFAHLGDFDIGPEKRIEIIGREHLPAHGPCLFVTAHIGNWELSAFTVAQMGFSPLSVIYRAPSNTGVGHIFTSARDAMGVRLIPKGASGARAALQVLKSGGNLGLLVDQKMNDGIAVPFFGAPAMTAPALAAFALKFGYPVIPVHIRRLDGARFQAICEPALDVSGPDGAKASALEIMTRVNALYERWIRAEPSQWLWLHNRWPEQ